MNIICFDCSTSFFTAAIQTPHSQASLNVELGLRHQEKLMELLSILCGFVNISPSAIQGVVCGRGPGSFTGLRVAMAAAKGISSALGIPMVSISLLEAIAAGHQYLPLRVSDGLVLPVIDAKKGKYYGAIFEAGHRRGDYFDYSADELTRWVQQSISAPRQIILCGPAAAQLKTQIADLDSHFDWRLSTHGQDDWGRQLLRLGAQMLANGNWDSRDTGPLYVRNQESDLGISFSKPKTGQ